MGQNKKFSLIISGLLFIPLKAQAFLDFCFPVSVTILYFVLGWPSTLIYELFPKTISETILERGFIGIFVLGFAIDFIVIFLLSYLVDRNQKRLQLPLKKRYMFKGPAFFVAAVIVLLLFMFIDPTCKL